MALIGIILLCIGIVISSGMELLEDLMGFDGFFLSPMRCYVMFMALSAIILTAMASVNRGTIIVGRTFGNMAVLSVSFIGVCILSSLNSGDITYSLKRTVSFSSIFSSNLLSYLVISASVAATTATEMRRRLATALKWTATAFFGIGAALSVFAILQEFTGLLVIKPEVRKFFGIPFMRVNSLFPDGNFFGYFIMIPALLAIRHRFARDNAGNLAVKATLFCCMSVALLLTGSRAAVLGLLLVLVYMLAERFVKRRTALLLIALVFAVMLGGIVYFVVSDFQSTFSIVERLDVDDLSAISRIMVWYSGVCLFLENPLLGVGPGNFITMTKGLYLAQFGIPDWQYNKISTLAGHSNYLELLTEVGVIGLALYLILVFYALWAASNAAAAFRNTTEGRTLRGYKYALLSCVFLNLFLSYYPYFLFIIFGLVAFVNDIAIHWKVAENRLYCSCRPVHYVSAYPPGSIPGEVTGRQLC